MPRGRRRRRVLLALGLVVTGLLGIWFSLPAWFPWVLRPLAPHVHAQFARYQREGYGRFSLYGFTYTNRTIRFKAQRIQGLTPTVWLARLATSAGKREQPFASVSGWQLDFVPSARPAGRSIRRPREQPRISASCSGGRLGWCFPTASSGSSLSASRFPL